MASKTSNLPELYRATRPGVQPQIIADFHVDELAGDMAGPFSPFGQDVEFPLPLDQHRLRAPWPGRSTPPRRRLSLDQ